MTNSTANKKVMVVEDNELNLKLFTDLLEAHSLTVVFTQDGSKAEAMAADEQPDLIIMDIQLPHISGIDIIKAIKATKSLQHIPILAVTAFAMQDDEEKIMAAGCEGYLAKPISIGPFINAVHKHLDIVGEKLA
jgi:two-component system cell cycle response regulator DivK